MGQLVNVKGMGQLPVDFHVKSKNFDFDNGSGANSHNESGIYATCKKNTFVGLDLFRDSFIVKGHKESNKYLITIDIDSEVKVALWNHGRIHLTYDEGRKNWQMKGELDGREWTFCDSYAVINRLIDGLQCMENDKNIDNSWKLAVSTIEKSLSKNKLQIAKEAREYTNNKDCKITQKVLKSFKNNKHTTKYPNGPEGDVPWW